MKDHQMSKTAYRKMLRESIRTFYDNLRKGILPPVPETEYPELNVIRRKAPDPTCKTAIE